MTLSYRRKLPDFFKTLFKNRKCFPAFIGAAVSRCIQGDYDCTLVEPRSRAMPNISSVSLKQAISTARQHCGEFCPRVGLVTFAVTVGADSRGEENDQM